MVAQQVNFLSRKQDEVCFILGRLATQAGSKKENQKMKGMNMESKESSWEIYFACGSWNLFLVPVEVQITLESNLPELPSQPGCAGPSSVWLLIQTAEQLLATALLAQELQKGEQLSILALKTSVKKSSYSIKVSFYEKGVRSPVCHLHFSFSPKHELENSSLLSFFFFLVGILTFC